MSQFLAQPSDVDLDRAPSDPAPERVERAGKIYTKKKANLPFLKSHKWPAKPPASKAKMTKEGSPPYERASDVSRSILRYSALLVLGTLLLSRMLTQSWAWGYSVNVMNYIPRHMHSFTEEELLQYNGADATKPIYLALDGDVYDVSANPGMYGKGGSYNHFAGVDAARAFVTGCFKTHLTHDTRGLSEKERQSLAGWKEFFRNHAKYYKVGKIVHAPLSSDTPLPPPCNAVSEGVAPQQ